MKELEKERNRKIMPKVLAALKKRGFDPYFFETADEARRFILDRIESQETVGVGGSVTLRQELGLVEALRKRGTYVCDHYDSYDVPAKRLVLQKEELRMDVFLTSVNALTFDGVLVNLDGSGNRVAATCCGPKKVIMATGTNKMVDSLDAAIQRTRNYAAVLNALRLKKNTPCVETGVCCDCDSPEKICAALLILLKKPNALERFTVVLINEELGY